MPRTVPANKGLLAGTVPANKRLLAVTVPANNLFQPENAYKNHQSSYLNSPIMLQFFFQNSPTQIDLKHKKNVLDFYNLFKNTFMNPTYSMYVFLLIISTQKLLIFQKFHNAEVLIEK